MNDFKLSREDSHNPVWLKLKEYFESELEFWRKKNDGDLDQIETARLRGKLSVLKNLLELDQPDRHQDAEYGFDNSNAAPPV